MDNSNYSNQKTKRQTISVIAQNNSMKPKDYLTKDSVDLFFESGHQFLLQKPRRKNTEFIKIDSIAQVSKREDVEKSIVNKVDY